MCVCVCVRVYMKSKNKCSRKDTNLVTEFILICFLFILMGLQSDKLEYCIKMSP